MMFRMLLADALAGAALALLAGCAHSTAPATGPRTIPLLPYVEELRKVEVEIDGRTYDFLFDTGGGYSLVAPQIKDAVNCRPSGKLTGFRMRGERVDFQKCGNVALQIGGGTFSFEAGLFDINTLIPDELPALYGVLTLQTFADDILTIDLANNRLILETQESLHERIRTMQPLDASFYNELEGRGMDVYLKVDASDKKVFMLLDSGNLGSNMLTPEAWREISGGEPPAESVKQELALRFGDAGTKVLPVIARALIREGALSVDFMASAVFTFDFPNRRAWVKWNDADATGDQ